MEKIPKNGRGKCRPLVVVPTIFVRDYEISVNPTRRGRKEAMIGPKEKENRREKSAGLV